MENSITELKSDLKELEGVLCKVTRTNVRQIIAESITTLKTKIDSLEQEKSEEKKGVTPLEEKKEKSVNKLYNVKISSYGWDQSDKFVKLYITVEGVNELTQEQLSFECTETSFKLSINNHRGRNLILQVMKLAHKIVPAESKPKLKSDMVLLMLRKEGKVNWGELTESQRKDKEAKDAKLSDKSPGMNSDDPSGGIMDLMKKMYDDGDDDMKRMIKKTWYETQQKQSSGEMPSL